MEVAGLNIVMDADFDQLYTGIAQANTMLQNFANNIKSVFTGIPDLKNKLNFSTNGASQAAQDVRELAQAKRLEAAASLDEARAKDIADKATERSNRTNRAAKDEYGQLVAANNELVRAYYNAAASVIKYGDAAGISAAKLEEMRKAAKAGQDQLQAIEAGVGRFQRQVGQYAKAFDPLNNSIQQILRETPSLAISLNTFFLAISNNLPIFFDALKQANANLAEIKAAAAAANVELSRQTEIQTAAAAATAKADAALADQLTLINANIGATEAQSKALSDQIAEQIIAAKTTAQSAAEIAIHTEALAINAGAAAEDAAALRTLVEANVLASRATATSTAALEAQAVATAEATAAAAAQPSVFASITKSLFSVNSLLTVGVLAFTLYGGKIANLVSGLGNVDEATKKYNDSLDKASKSAQVNAANEASKMRILVDIAQDSLQSMEERLDAVSALQKAYPSYFGNLSKEAILYGDLTDTINKTSLALYHKGIADAYAAKANVANNRFVDEKENLDKATDAAAKYYIQNEKAIKQQEQSSALNAKLSSNVRSIGVTQTRELAKYLSLEKDRQDALQKTLAAQEDIFGFQRKAAAEARQAGGLFVDHPADKNAKPDKVVRDLTSALDDLIAKNKEVDIQLSDGSISAEEAISKKLGNYKAYIQEITKTSKFRVDVDDSRVSDANAQIQSLSKTLTALQKNNNVDDVLQNYNNAIQSIGDNKIDGVISEVDALKQSINAANVAKKALLKIDTEGDFTSFVDLFTNSIKNLKSELGDAELQEDGIKLNATFDLINSQLGNKLITGAEAATQKLSALRAELKKLIEDNKQGSRNQAIDDIKEQITDLEKQQLFKNLISNISTQLKQGLTDIGTSLGEGIGNILSGTGGLGDLLGGLVGVLADNLSALGKQLITYGVALTGIWDAIESLGLAGPLGGAIAIGAGIAAVAAGQLMKSAMTDKANKKVAMASGAIAYGPTSALVGEYATARSNPEVIAPLDKLKTILKNSGAGNGSNQVFIPDVRIQGQDLLVVFKRAQNSFSR